MDIWHEMQSKKRTPYLHSEKRVRFSLQKNPRKCGPSGGSIMRTGQKGLEDTGAARESYHNPRRSRISLLMPSAFARRRLFPLNSTG